MILYIYMYYLEFSALATHATNNRCLIEDAHTSRSLTNQPHDTSSRPQAQPADPALGARCDAAARLGERVAELLHELRQQHTHTSRHL